MNRIIISFLLYSVAAFSQQPDWTHFVRIAGHGLSANNIEQIMKSVKETNVFGIETDNDITGRYDSFLDPQEKLEVIKIMAEKAHAAGNHSFVYIAGLECITANADKSGHSFFKDHPDWVQRDINGRPAVFGGGTAFWIRPGDEDVWISPYAEEWRKIYMQRVRQIAATGIDGIYVDIPYWMTHFESWEDTWASFDDYTVAAFKEKTGLNAKTDLKLGDFSDAHFRKWVDFRIQTICDFMREIDENVKAVNPDCKTIAEIYPGPGADAVIVGADVYRLYSVVDVITHEYSVGGYTAAERNPFDWFTFMAAMHTFRDCAQDKPSWMLTYSWDGQKNIRPADAMKLLAVSHLMAGANIWDAQGHVMSGSNDYEMRAKIFKWVENNQNKFYLNRKSINPIGVYFSPETRDYFADSYMESFYGFLHMLMQKHLEFKIVTSRTLSDFSGSILILPDAKCLSNRELQELKSYYKKENGLVFCGETGRYDTSGKPLSHNRIFAALGLKKEKETSYISQKDRYIYYQDSPGELYYQLAQKDSITAARGETDGNTTADDFRENFIRNLIRTFEYRTAGTIEASPFVSMQLAEVDGKKTMFLTNFKGIRAKQNVIPEAAKNITVRFKADQDKRIIMQGFLEEEKVLETEWDGNFVCAVIPEIKWGAVVWSE
ncbi:MAG TPA: hypothetical protein EYP36_12145 [Calditrichaeota bacterium]|nr:hypothetical protein [Calditrichota bacterium]